MTEIRIGEKVQVWDSTDFICLGWGEIIQIAVRERDKEEIPLIQLESGKKVWGDKVSWILEKKAISIGVRIFTNLTRDQNDPR